MAEMQSNSSSVLVKKKRRFPIWQRWLFVCGIFLLFIGLFLSTFIFPQQKWIAFVTTFISICSFMVPLAQQILLSASTEAPEVPTDTKSPSQNASLRVAWLPSGENAKQKPIESIKAPVSNSESLPQPGDVFFFNEEIPSASEFYGRERERYDIENRIKHRGSTSIVGPRRIGKTWLLKYVGLIVQEKGDEHIRVGYIDTTIPDFNVNRFTIRAINALSDVPFNGTSNIGLAFLFDKVEEMIARKQIPVLCIDEFEGFGKVAEFDTNFFAHLRAIAQVGLVLITASKTPLIEIVGDSGKTSGFYNIFEQLPLAPFNEKEAQRFADEKSQQARFTDEERQRLLHHSKLEGQWPPLRMQLTGKMLLTYKSAEPKDLDFWQRFEQELEMKYRGVVRS